MNEYIYPCTKFLKKWRLYKQLSQFMSVSNHFIFTYYNWFFSRNNSWPLQGSVLYFGTTS
jgi:hypothetical protein